MIMMCKAWKIVLPKNSIMRKLIYIFSVTSLGFILFSCPAGLAVVYLDVQIEPQKEDGTNFTVEELKYFKLQSYGSSSCGYGKILGEDGYILTNEPKNPINKNGKGIFITKYYLGKGHFNLTVEKLKNSYKDKIAKHIFSFSIEDPDGVYETFTMNLADDKYTVVNQSIPCIKYTVKLKKVN
ncbi:hypothetical protein [Treponema pedis]|uniref:hypothetical protein n=2 Tax=Treponema pedis TaxID=409322 RepID=UPI003D21925A